jgi:DNA-binding Lrp family transcriptional regulator
MSRLEDFEYMLHYMRMLDPINAKILEGLGKYGPRNLLSLAKSIRLPPTTVSFRIKKLTEDGHLKIRSRPDYSKLGLMRAAVIAEALPGFEDKLQKSIENIGYWTYITKCYGRFNGFYSVLAFPAENKKDLETYLKDAVRLKAFSRCNFYWTTNFCEVAPNFDWFDFERKEWNFKWQEWVDEVLNSSQTLSQHILESKRYPVMVDETDLLILKEMEKNGVVDFAQLAKVAGTTPQSIGYRFHRHIVKRKLIADHEISIFPYPSQVSDMCCFVINFKNEKTLASFSNTLHNKSFVINFGKVIGQNSLMVHMYTPKLEFPHLIDSLSHLARKNIISSFFYVTLDILSFKRQTIAYELFKNDTWIYDQRDSIERLKKSINS